MDRRLSFLAASSLAVLLFTSAVFAADTTTTKPGMEHAKDSWNNVICTILKVLEYTSVGLAALIIMAAGLRFMSSADDPEARQKSKQMIIQALAGLVFIFSAVQIVNYLATGTKIERFDMNACNVSIGGAGGNATGTTSTTIGGVVNSSTTSSSTRRTTTSTTSSTPTTDCLNPDTTKQQEQITSCNIAQDWRHLDPDMDMCDVVSKWGLTADCCCSHNLGCCPE